MKKLLWLLLALLAAAAVAAAGILSYIRPEQQLDLTYKKINLESKFVSMVKNRQFSLEISDEEMNDLLKEKLAEKPEVSPGIRVTGARFQRENDRLLADVNVDVKGKLPAGVQLEYRLEWKAPYLSAVYQGARIRSVNLPQTWLDPGDFKINMNEAVPRPLGIQEVIFDDKAITVWLKLQL